MSSGNKRQIFNTRERAVSDDLNRMQSHIAFEIAQRMRFMLSVAASRDNYNSVLATVGTVSDPLEMHVIEGLIVQPQPGQDFVHISFGSAFVVDPDGVTGSSDPNPANPDDNEFKYLSTSGVLDNSLTHPANAGPGIRIDVIECQRNDGVIETDNRDVFNPSTGQFNPVSVDKVAKGDMTFRIRSGSPGGGFPGTAQGWAPLAVASVPASFSSTDDITYWDVRPLVADRAFPPFNSSLANPPYRQFEAWIEEVTATSDSQLTGIVETVLGAYRAGGTIKGSVPGVGDFQVLNVLDAANYGDGNPLTANANWYVYALQPFGLPRWARYSAAAPRNPGPFNGIAVVTPTPPAGWTSVVASAAITIPTATGLVGSTTNAALIFAFRTHPTASPVEVDAHAGVNGFIAFPETSFVSLPAPAFTTVNGAARYAATPNTHFPANARYLRVQFRGDFTGTVGAEASIQPFGLAYGPNPDITIGGTRGAIVDEQMKQWFVVDSSGGGTLITNMRIPLRPNWGPGVYTALADQKFGINWNALGISVNTHTAFINGWEF